VLPGTFVQALLAMSYRPVALSGASDEKVVDVGILKTLDALRSHPDADVLLCTHDADFVEALARLQADGRQVGVLALREFTSTQYAAADIEIHDLEYQVSAFNVPLPRVRIISLDDFDPEQFLR
jgi:uncharacterized protein